MRNTMRNRWMRAVAAVALVVAIAVIAAGLYLADQAGKLPWQEDPTRISTSLTPFADIPGFTAPTAIPTATTAP